MFVAISACESELDKLGAFEDSSVSFRTATASLAEATVVGSADKTDTKVGSSFAIDVIRNTSNISSDLAVTFTVSSQFLSDSDFAGAGDDASETFNLSIEGSNGTYTVTIPAGSASSQFVLRSNDDLFSSGDKQVVFTITSADGAKIGLGNSGIGKSLTLTIVDDDCPITIADWVGTYTVEEVFTSGANEGLTLAGAFDETYELVLALAPNDATGTKVVITNAPGANVYMANGTVMTFITCTKQVAFDPLPLRLALFANLNITASEYNEGQLKITVSGPLGNFGPYQFILTKQTN